MAISIFLGFVDQGHELLSIFHSVGHRCGNELYRVIGFEPGRLVGDKGISAA
jgi:hypothetical protein